jgi:hypothetical protein
VKIPEAQGSIDCSPKTRFSKFIQTIQRSYLISLCQCRVVENTVSENSMLSSKASTVCPTWIISVALSSIACPRKLIFLSNFDWEVSIHPNHCFASPFTIDYGKHFTTTYESSNLPVTRQKKGLQFQAE